MKNTRQDAYVDMTMTVKGCVNKDGETRRKTHSLTLGLDECQRGCQKMQSTSRPC